MPDFEYEFVSYDELYQAYIDCRRRKRGTGNEICFEINENRNLYNLYIQLNTLQYKIGRSICFIVDRPVHREVFAADFIDRVVHHLFINRINNYIEQEFIEDTYSCRVGKGTQYGVNKCYQYIKECSKNYTKDCYILKCDLKSFFVTINKDKLYNMLSYFLEDKCGYTDDNLKFMRWLLCLIIYNDPTDGCIMKGDKSDWNKLPKDKSLFNTDKKHGLPIGNLTSQIFANFYLSYFDHFVKYSCDFCYYGRYVDDFFIVHESKEKLISSLSVFRKELMKNDITLHPKKVYLQHYSKGVKFIGHVIKPNRIYIGNRTKGNFYATIINAGNILKKENITYEEADKFVNSINSYLGFMKNYSTYNIRKKYLKLDEFLKFYNIGKTYVSYNKINLLTRKEMYILK